MFCRVTLVHTLSEASSLLCASLINLDELWDSHLLYMQEAPLREVRWSAGIAPHINLDTRL